MQNLQDLKKHMILRNKDIFDLIGIQFSSVFIKN